MPDYLTSGYLGGAMPPMGAAPPLGGSPESIQQGYQRAYDSALSQNTALYNNVLSGYQQTAAGQRTAQDALAAGYAGLSGRIGSQLGDAAAASRQGYADLGGTAAWMGGTLGEMYDRQRDIDSRYETLRGDARGGYGALLDSALGEVAGLGRERNFQIDEDYARASGAARQSLARRGLGNSTLVDSAQRGLDFDRARARNELSERMAGLRAGFRERIGGAGLAADLGLGQAGLGFRERAGAAQVDQANRHTLARYGAQEAGVRSADDYARLAAGYGSQIGMAGLGEQSRGIDRNTGLATRQLDWMNSVSAPYPNPAMYAQVAQMAGANQSGGAGGRANMFDFAGSPEGMVRTASSGGTVPSGGGYVGSGLRGAAASAPTAGGYFSAFQPGAGGFYSAAGSGGGGLAVPEAAAGAGYYGYDPADDYSASLAAGEQYQLTDEELAAMLGEAQSGGAYGEF